MRVTCRSRLGASAGQHHRQVGRQEWLASELVANLPDVLSRGEVGVGARGAFRGERDHSRAERGQDGRGQGRRRTPPGRLSHSIQILPHGRDRPAVVVPAGGDHWGVTDAKSQDESIGPRFGDRSTSRCHRHRIARPDVRDAAGHHQPRRGTQEDRRLCERLASCRLPVPQRPIAELLDLGRDLSLDGRRLGLE